MGRKFIFKPFLVKSDITPGGTGLIQGDDWVSDEKPTQSSLQAIVDDFVGGFWQRGDKKVPSGRSELAPRVRIKESTVRRDTFTTKKGTFFSRFRDTITGRFVSAKRFRGFKPSEVNDVA